MSTLCDITFRDTEQEVISDQKKSSRNGPGSHVPSKTSGHGPSTRTALKLGSEDSQLSVACARQVWWRPVSCEASNRGSGEVLFAKSTFFPLLLNRTRDARILCGFQPHKGITCLFSVFWNDNNWPEHWQGRSYRNKRHLVSSPPPHERLKISIRNSQNLRNASNRYGV